MSPGLLLQSDAEFFLLLEESFGACCSFTVMSSKLVWNCSGTLPVNTDMEYLTGRRALDVRVFKGLNWLLCAFVSHSLLLWVLQMSLWDCPVGKCFAWCFPQTSARAEVPALPCLPALTPAAPWECSLFSNSPSLQWGWGQS